MNEAPSTLDTVSRHRRNADGPFVASLFTISAAYLCLILAILIAMVVFTTPAHLWQAIQSSEIRYAIKLSLLSCTLTMIFSMWVAVPIGYLMSRYRFWGKHLVDAILDIPIVLPPLVIGLALLILFNLPIFHDASAAAGAPGAARTLETLINDKLGLAVTYAIPAVILAQFTVACAFAVRTMRVTFEQIDPRREQVALTLGCTRMQAFGMVVLPEAGRGMLSAATLAWARAMGEFGPILVFAGATRMRTEVLPTTVFLELSVGHTEAAVAVSLIMVLAALAVLIIVRLFGLRKPVV